MEDEKKQETLLIPCYSATIYL